MAYNSSQIDNLIALRLLKILTTPFNEFPAYKVGVIDEKGKYIVPKNKRDAKQRRSLTYLDRLMINIKKLINKLPGGENKLKNLIAAMVLIKECHDKQDDGETLTEQYVEQYINDFESEDTHYKRIANMWEMYIKLKEQTTAAAISGTAGADSHVANNNTSGIEIYSAPMGDAIIRRYDLRDRKQK